MSRVQILKLDDLNTIVIKKDKDDNFFITSPDSIVISIFNFSVLLKVMLYQNKISPKLLESLIEEYRSYKGDL
jgi:hypothetical protein